MSSTKKTYHTITEKADPGLLVLNELPEPVFIYSPEGAIHFTNSTAREYLEKWQCAHIKNFFDLFQSDRAEIQQYHQELASQQKSHRAFHTTVDTELTRLQYVVLQTKWWQKGDDAFHFISQLHIRDLKEEELIEREVFHEKYEHLLENAPAMIWFTNRENTPVFNNKTLRNFLGADLCKLTKEEFIALIHPSDRKVAIDDFYEAVVNKREFSGEFRVHIRNGTYKWVLEKASPQFDQQGQYLGYNGTFTDITELKATQESLLFTRTETLIAASFPEFNPNPLIRLNVKGDILFRNESSQWLEDVFYENRYYSLNEFCIFIARHTVDRHWYHQVEISRKYFNIYCRKMEQTSYINVYFNDVTGLVHATMQLKNNEKKYRYLAENSKDLICLHNNFDHLIYVSPSAQKLLHYDAEDMLGKTLMEFCHPEDAILYRSAMDKINAGKEDIITLEIRLRNIHGNFQWFEMQLYPVMENGEVSAIQSSSRDVSQLKFQELRTKMSELKYRKLIDNMDLGYVEVDDNGKMIYANESFCRLTRYSLEELAGKSPEELLLTDKELKDEMNAHNELRKQGVAEVYQLRIKRKDGVERTVLISGSPVINEQGMISGSAGIHWDITPMIEMEEMLHDKEIQRQRSILQASIRTEEKQKQTLGRELHDGLGQMLAYISLNMQLMLDKQVPAREIVENTKVLINKAITDIRQLSRTLIPVALDSTKSLREILSEALASFVNMKGLRFEFVVYDPAIDQKLSLDQKHSIFRIVQELTNNTIKYAEAGQITVSIRDTGKQCAIRYTDDGKGFTRHKVKKGVGFESIETRVESYQGKLSIQSGKGKGIKVQISIPYSKQKAKAELE